MSRHFGGVQPGRQSDKAKTVLLVSMFFVVLFSVLAFVLLSAGPAKDEPKPQTVVVETEPEVKMVEVLVPLQEIAAGTLLEPRLFRKEQRPQVGISDKAVRGMEEIDRFYAKSLIVAGQPVLRDYLTPNPPTNPLTSSIPEGYRAVTIRVDARTSVEGFTRPGSRVDVVWASTIRGQPGVTVIVQNAFVLSAERSVDQQNKSGVPVPTTVTLRVTAQDAAKIQLASTTGKLSLSLRGQDDGGKADLGTSITTDDLLGVKASGRKVDSEGSVMIGGEKYLLVNGQLIPESKVKKQEQ